LKIKKPKKLTFQVFLKWLWTALLTMQLNFPSRTDRGMPSERLRL